MDSIDIGSLVLVGALVSVVVQILKAQFGSNRIAATLAVIVLSLVGGGVYVAFKDTTYWVTFLQILMAASTIYAVIISAFEKK